MNIVSVNGDDDGDDDGGGAAVQGVWKYCNNQQPKSGCNISHRDAIFPTETQYFPRRRNISDITKIRHFSTKLSFLTVLFEIFLVFSKLGGHM